MKTMTASEAIQTREEHLERIARYLLLNGGFTNNISLNAGKTGISFFMLHYARYKQVKMYHSFGEDLLQEVFNTMNLKSGKGFGTGLAGIAWSIEHLLQHDLIQMNESSLEVLVDIDDAVYAWNYELTWGFSEGLTGYLLYMQNRINREGYNSEDLDKIIRYEVYISMIDRLERIFIRKFREDSNALSRFIADNKYTATAKNTEICNHAKVITILARSLHYDIYPVVTMRLLERMIACINPAFAAMKQNIPDNLHDAFMHFNIQVELCQACWNAWKYTGNESWRDTAREQLLAAIDTYMPLTGAAFDNIVYLQKTIFMAQVYRRAYLEMQEPAFERACNEITDHLISLSYTAIAKENDKCMGITEGLAGIGLVVLSGIDAETCFWDECLLIS
ncbi:lanthionine synthetase-like protein [Chitinophaga niastensis]|uniref:Lanthionine synthetase-like protein n=1 Tax=Chitinophaga niastensis TaxID=536980 RepID=A0A2P8HTF2_CHINA|nr:lanthionine synthetase LanC family protein [Chitinophaga niastensis]PSL49465.1 lanthionine synthetase-like protein [Chitinophaga niastensis]